MEIFHLRKEISVKVHKYFGNDPWLVVTSWSICFLVSFYGQGLWEHRHFVRTYTSTWKDTHVLLLINLHGELIFSTGYWDEGKPAGMGQNQKGTGEAVEDAAEGLGVPNHALTVLPCWSHSLPFPSRKGTEVLSSLKLKIQFDWFLFGALSFLGMIEDKFWENTTERKIIALWKNAFPTTSRVLHWTLKDEETVSKNS